MESYVGFSSIFFSGFFGTFWVLVAVGVVSMWKVYQKAGQPGWASLIPIYNIIILLEIVRKPWWWLLLMFTPVGFIWIIWTKNLLSKAFGKGEGFTVGLILLPIVFYPILAFDDSLYEFEQSRFEY